MSPHRYSRDEEQEAWPVPCNPKFGVTWGIFYVRAPVHGGLDGRVIDVIIAASKTGDLALDDPDALAALITEYGGRELLAIT